MPGTTLPTDVPGYEPSASKKGTCADKLQMPERKQECASLFAGSKFVGEQKSGRSAYEVTVELQYVDLRASFLCGYLNIKGLTEDWPDLCTFFEAEIVGPRHGFLTKKWGANEITDREHWSQFPAFEEFASHYCDDSQGPDYQRSDVIFMRWKITASKI
ncbi:GID complex subunit 4, VID24 [Dinochytrium kinnereticum]|nr:GID complex subunit 4, VID24 [Dinochytrium kinnereticum]